MKGLKGTFNSPINGDTVKKGNTNVPRVYNLRINKSEVTDELDGLTKIDYSERYELYYNKKKNKRGFNGVIVVIR